MHAVPVASLMMWRWYVWMLAVNPVLLKSLLYFISVEYLADDDWFSSLVCLLYPEIPGM
jgi:hypothetical protein